MCNVVYKFTCLHNANMSYIGMTSRHLVTKALEHLHSTVNETGITLHINSCSSCGSSNFGSDSYKVQSMLTIA